MNDQPNGRSKHDPRQSSHNRDPLEKKFFFSFLFLLDWGVETAVATTVAGRDWLPRGGRRGPTMPGPALPFPRDFRHPHQVTGRARRETGTPLPVLRGVRKKGATLAIRKGGLDFDPSL